MIWRVWWLALAISLTHLFCNNRTKTICIFVLYIYTIILQYFPFYLSHLYLYFSLPPTTLSPTHQPSSFIRPFRYVTHNVFMYKVLFSLHFALMPMLSGDHLNLCILYSNSFLLMFGFEQKAYDCRFKYSKFMCMWYLLLLANIRWFEQLAYDNEKRLYMSTSHLYMVYVVAHRIEYRL